MYWDNFNFYLLTDLNFKIVSSFQTVQYKMCYKDFTYNITQPQLVSTDFRQRLKSEIS